MKVITQNEQQRITSDEKGTCALEVKFEGVFVLSYEFSVFELCEQVEYFHENAANNAASEKAT